MEQNESTLKDVSHQNVTENVSAQGVFMRGDDNRKSE